MNDNYYCARIRGWLQVLSLNV